jgi:hypothetical protein
MMGRLGVGRGRFHLRQEAGIRDQYKSAMESSAPRNNCIRKEPVKKNNVYELSNLHQAKCIRAVSFSLISFFFFFSDSLKSKQADLLLLGVSE